MSMATRTQAAQNQHYVPRFILRNFLRVDAPAGREQVNVFSKKTGKVFTPSIDGIMAERRFNEFAIGDEYIASFEDSIGQIEQMLLPVYRRILADRKLDRSPDEQAALAFFIAFQMLRTRASRDHFGQLEEMLGDHLAKIGAKLEDLEGYEPLTDERLAFQHIDFMRSSLPKFGEILAGKFMCLMQAPKGRRFYLGDNPVSLHNSAPAHPLWGNLGLAVEGIEIYLPLSADLMLAAWCPSIIERMVKERDDGRATLAGESLRRLAARALRPEQMREVLDGYDRLTANITKTIVTLVSGEPVLLDSDNMDFANSLQVTYARDFIICPQGDFDLAARFMRENPGHRGFRMANAH